MLSVNELGKLYYLRDFHDMRCKYGRVLSVIRQQMNREPQAGEAYIMMSKDCQTVRLYSYDRHSCSLYEKRFEKGYKFMKVTYVGDLPMFSVIWDDVVVQLGSPVVKTLKIKQLYCILFGCVRYFSYLYRVKEYRHGQWKTGNSYWNRPADWSVGRTRPVPCRMTMPT